ncbi:MAG: MTH1187 family thiamine-binding protein [Dehalococcoidia bacterium]|nr:MAG: MTH1187 family thiamine-binding protein [Dehalococcoidia bacterium]
MALADVTIIPLGTGTPSVSKYVAGTIKTLQREKGIKYEITPMGTVIEGDLDKILAVVKEMHEETFTEGVARVVTVIKIDDRRDKKLSMSGKVESLMKELQSR